MTMSVESPLSKREAFMRNRSSKSIRRINADDDGANDQHQHSSAVPRRRVDRSGSTRGASRANARDAWSRRLHEEEEEEVQDIMEQNDNGSPTKPHKRRPVRRTTSDENNTAPPPRRGVQRHKSCDGSTMPFQRVQRRHLVASAKMDRTASVRRLTREVGGRSRSQRHLMATVNNDSSGRGHHPNHKSKSSDRRLAAAAAMTMTMTDDSPMKMPIRSSGMMIDGSSDAGRSVRRTLSHSHSHNNQIMEDMSGSDRRRIGRTKSGDHYRSSPSTSKTAAALSAAFSSSTATGRSMTGSGRHRSYRRDNSKRHLPDLAKLQLASEDDNDSDDDDEFDLEGKVVTRGKGLDDCSRRRQAPTLSKMSIDQLRDRLVKKDEKEEDHMEDSGSSSHQPDWDMAEDAPPLEHNLNDDDF